jgi:pimeloyl-ACP methyl ester carboxylesterase
MEDHASDLLALLDRLNVIRFVPVGHSMGGYILFAIHRLARERMSGAALVCTRAAADSPDAKKLREENATRVLKEGMRVLADTMPDKVLGSDARPPTKEEVKKLILSGNPTGAAAALRAMAQRPNSTSQLSQFKFPTLVVAGKGDKLVPPTESESMAKAIPDAKLVMFEGAGHMPMIEKPETLTKTLQEFLRKV